MAAAQNYEVSSLSADGHGSNNVDDSFPDQFPVGLRVLVVDPDNTSLKSLEELLQRFTTCCQATAALDLLRERKSCFDVVISDVELPDMDGFEFFEVVGLEMDLPLIMMSAEGGASAVMQGVKHGACDYLIKPVRFGELKNIWQHVLRRKYYGSNKELEQSGCIEESDRYEQSADDADYGLSADAEDEEEGGEYDKGDASAAEKQCVVWSVDLHQQFVSAVNQLGVVSKKFP